MHRLKQLAGAVIAVSLLSVPTLGNAQAGQTAKASGSGVEQQIDALTQQIMQAQVHGDPAPYQKYYADNAIIIHAAGQVFTKSEEIANLKSGETKYESYDVRNKTVHLYRDTAVVESLVAAKGILKGQPFDSEFRVTRIWAKSSGNWKVVVFQTTRVAPPSR